MRIPASATVRIGQVRKIVPISANRAAVIAKPQLAQLQAHMRNKHGQFSKKMAPMIFEREWEVTYNIVRC